MESEVLNPVTLQYKVPVPELTVVVLIPVVDPVEQVCIIQELPFQIYPLAQEQVPVTVVPVLSQELATVPLYPV